MKNLSEIIFLYKNILFRQRAMSRYRELLTNQQLDKNALAALNWKKRKLIVEHAYNNTDFYREFYDSHNFHPSMLVTENDWDKVPILEKEMIRKNLQKMIMNGVSPKRLTSSTTGGSTGEPLKVYHDKTSYQETLAWRYLGWWNVSISDNVGTIHRAVPTTLLAKVIKGCLWFPTRRAYLNASSFNNHDIAKFIDTIQRKKITRITGYVGGVEKVAEYILESNINMTGVTHVWTTSAPLSLVARKKIEKAFSCKVMDQYGSCEVFSIAQQCPYCDGIHINSDVNHVDIVGPDDLAVKNDYPGDILITNMDSFAFPIIKYRNGDRSNLLFTQDQKCTLPFPLLNFVSGRISDTLSTPSGIILTGDYWTTIFDAVTDYVLAFQVRQRKDFSITIYVVVNDKMPDNGEAIIHVRNTVIAKVRNEVPVNIEIVDKIADDRGKTRYIIKEK